jgi:hypothetical protein
MESKRWKPFSPFFFDLSNFLQKMGILRFGGFWDVDTRHAEKKKLPTNPKMIGGNFSTEIAANRQR